MGLKRRPGMMSHASLTQSESVKQRMLLLEHLNLNCPSSTQARAFYIDVLGCAPNPKGSASKTTDGCLRQNHFNCGLSQFHCAWRDPDGVYNSAQVLTGTVILVTTESLSDLLHRLQKDPPEALKGTNFSFQ